MLRLGEVLHTDRYQVTYYLLNDSLYRTLRKHRMFCTSLYITTTYGKHTLRGGKSTPLEKEDIHTSHVGALLYAVKAVGFQPLS